MREIKFRAWIPKLGLQEENYPKVGTMFHWEEQQGLGNSYGAAEGFKYKTVMQFTGLFDKNGKEIYEGDIVRGGKCDGQVEWDEDGYVVNPFPSNAFATQLRNENKMIEVIGNIYKNPNLLTK